MKSILRPFCYHAGFYFNSKSVIRLTALAILLVITAEKVIAQTFTAKPFNTDVNLFVENKGQVTDQNGNGMPDVKYIYAAKGFKLALRGKGFSYEQYNVINEDQNISEASGMPERQIKFKQGSGKTIVKAHRIDVEFDGLKSIPFITASDKDISYNNYFLTRANNQVANTGMACYATITYQNVWPGIDIVFSVQKDKGLKYDIVLHPGSQISDISFAYNGVKNAKLSNGTLLLGTSLGTITESMPRSYILENGKDINMNYKLTGKKHISYTGSYDKEKTLVIDPALMWSTYFGNISSDRVYASSIVKTNIYYAGLTNGASNIISSGAYQTSFAGGTDIFVAKFNTNGRRLWCTYYGGNSDDEAYAMVADTATDNVYIGGYTSSTSGIATSGAFNTKYFGYEAVFAKFSSSGSLLYGTYYGNNGYSDIHGLTMDAIGNVYATGITQSTSGIASSGGYQTKLGSLYINDAFIVKFNSKGARIWGTYFGDTGDDFGYAIAINSNALYITGYTDSKTGMATSGAYQTSWSGKDDGFVARFDTAGSYKWGTYLGGTLEDYGWAITTDKSGNVIAGGYAWSTSGFASSGAFQTSAGGNGDAYLVKFNSSGSMIWGTFIGGGYSDFINSLTTDTAGNIYLAGSSGGGSSILTSDALETNDGGSYFAIFSPTGSLKYGTLFGGHGITEGKSIKLDNYNNVFICGVATDNTTGLATVGAFQTTKGGTTSSDEDGYMAKFTLSKYERALVKLYSPATACTYDSVRIKVVIKNNSSFADSNFAFNIAIPGKTITARAYGILQPGAQDTFILSRPIGFSSAGTFTIKVFQSKDQDASNDTLKTSITINGRLSPAFSLVNTSACVNTLTTFSEYTTIPTGFSVVKHLWKWGNGDTSVSAGSATYHTFKQSGTYNVKLFITSNKGCTDSVSKNITVNKRPVAGFYYQDNCNGSIINFTDTSKGTSPQHIWNFGNGAPTTNIKNPGCAYKKPGRYIVTLIEVESITGCADTSRKLITVRPKPVSGFTSSNVCQGNSSIFNNTSTIDSGTIQAYKWYFKDGDSSSLQSPTHLYKDTGSYKVDLICTGNSGCIDTIEKKIQVFSLPVANFSIPKQGCENANLSFTNSSTSATAYTWYFGDGDSSNVKNPTHTYASAGSYQVRLKVVNANGCNAIIKDSISIKALPDANFLINGQSGPTFSFIPDDSTLTSYAWNFGDGKTGNSIKMQHTFTHKAIYNITLIVKNKYNCTSQITKTLDVLLGDIANKVQPENGWTIYPNPVSGNRFTIAWDNAGTGQNAELNMYDVTGRCVYSCKVIKNGNNNIELPVQLQSGIYSLQLSDESNNVTIKKVILLK